MLHIHLMQPGVPRSLENLNVFDFRKMQDVPQVLFNIATLR